MDDISNPLGIAIIVIAAVVLMKAAKTIIKLAMVALIVIGFYIWFGLKSAEALLS
jgi:hypothetical protein